MSEEISTENNENWKPKNVVQQEGFNKGAIADVELAQIGADIGKIRRDTSRESFHTDQDFEEWVNEGEEEAMRDELTARAQEAMVASGTGKDFAEANAKRVSAGLAEEHASKVEERKSDAQGQWKPIETTEEHSFPEVLLPGIAPEDIQRYTSLVSKEAIHRLQEDLKYILNKQKELLHPSLVPSQRESMVSNVNLERERLAARIKDTLESYDRATK